MEHGFTIRGVGIGGGHTRICVPIMPATLCELEEVLCRLDMSAFDILEWRADALQGAVLADYIAGLKIIRQKLGEAVPVLFTLRTTREGGSFSGTVHELTAVMVGVAQTSAADMLDIELSVGDENVRAVVTAAKKTGIKVIVSHHNFAKIYPLEDIAGIYERMFELGADVAKIALMPANVGECLMIMGAAERVQRECQNRAIILIGMGQHGLSSRIMAREIGSCIAFAFDTAAGVSAPGQISAQDMRQIFEIIGRYSNFKSNS